MRLLIDIGNTRLKWCCDFGTGLSASRALDYRNADCDTLRQLWSQLDEPECVAISCVAVSDIRTMIVERVRDLWPTVSIVMAATGRHALGVVNGYARPEVLGVDRWLAIVAAFRLYPSPLCVVDCGTAMTADWVDAKGFHQGGLIAPGLGLMRKALFSNTAQLDEAAMRASLELARDTAGGIANGSMTASVGFIEVLRTQLGRQGTWVLTGGDADAIAVSLNFQVIVDQQLVMKGLSMVCDEGGAS